MKVYLLDSGTLMLDESFATWNHNQGIEFRFPVFSLYIDHPDGKLLIDTGFEKGWVDRKLPRHLQTFTALIDLARAESGLSRESLEPVALDQLVVDVVELFEPLAESRGQTLSLDRQPVRALAHRQILFQALGNLVENAIKYSPEGARIRVALERNGREAQFRIVDSGAGIPVAVVEQAKRAFVRLENSRDIPGSGLGLAIAAAAAKLHDGTLVLESTGDGFCARLTLAALA